MSGSAQNSQGIGNLSTLIKRLEAATSRLEDIALAQPGAGALQASLGPAAASAAAGGAAGAAAATAAAAASSVHVEVPKAVEEWDEAVAPAIEQFVKLSAGIGGLVQEQFAELLQPLQASLVAASEMRDKNRAEKKLFNHLSAVSEGIPALGWVAVEPKPAPYIGDMKDSAQFYLNRVAKDFKDVDKSHVEWGRSFTSLLEALRAYVLKNHTTGLVWNPKGGDMAKFVVPGQAAAAPEASGAPAPPPPPPPPPADFGVPPPPPPPPAPAADATGAGGMDAVFSQLNQGENITKGLRKVDASQMTHKNPELRSQAAAPTAGASKPAPPRPGTKPAALRPKKPAKTALEGNKWTVEHHEENHHIVIEDTELNHTVNIFGCKNSTVQIKGKINAVSIVSCTKTSVLLDSLVSSLEVTASPSFAVEVKGRVPTILVDSCDSGQIFLSAACLPGRGGDGGDGTEIVSAKCSALNVSVPVEGGEEGEFAERALPEQLRHRIDAHGAVRSEVVGLSH